MTVLALCVLVAAVMRVQPGTAVPPTSTAPNLKMTVPWNSGIGNLSKRVQSINPLHEDLYVNAEIQYPKMPQSYERHTHNLFIVVQPLRVGYNQDFRLCSGF